MPWISAMTDDAKDSKTKPFKRSFNAVPLSELVPELLDPVMQKRAGLTTALIGAWLEIAGERIGRFSSPSKIGWSRANASSDPFAPATLFINADPAVALALQHETSAIISRINGFFGYPAIDRVKITQKQVQMNLGKQIKRKPNASDLEMALKKVALVENDALREALAQL
ncbi:MAG: DUF721 domain-containing protein, partial [Notoacmeibacter sp.]